MNHPTEPPPSARRRAFTLLELLTVVAVIGIIAAIVMPNAQSITIKARRAKTRAQFNQWALAMEMFNAEYGAYPAIDGNYSNGRSVAPNLVNTDKFAVALSGRKIDGTDAELRATSATAQTKVSNTRLISFYTIAPGEIDTNSNPPDLVDYFGNKEIGVAYDKNGDGIINSSDVKVVPPVSARAGGKFTPDTTNDIPLGGASGGIHAPVIFYSPGPGDSQSTAPIEASEAVFSWK